MARHPRQVVGTALLLVLLGCEAPALSPTRSPIRWELERVETQPAPAVSAPVDTAGRQISESSTPPQVLPSTVPSLRPGGNGGGNGGGVAAAPAGPPRGRVYAYPTLGLAPAPLAGATVWTSDGRSAVTDDDGRFTFTGEWPADGTWIVHHPGYHASTVVGLVPNGPLEFHLKTHTALVGPASPTGAHTFEVAGRVVDKNGAPVEAVTVLMNSKDGSFGTPAFTAADGTFEMKVLAHGDTVSDAAFVAVDYDTEAWMGVAKGITLSKLERDVDFNASAPGPNDFAIEAISHTLRLNVTSAPAGMRAISYVDMVVPGMGTIPIYGLDNAVGVANLPGVDFTARVFAADADQFRQSTYVREKVALDFRQAETVLDVALLAPPVVHPIAGPLTSVGWDAVAGAKGYEVRLDSIDAGGLQWEGFTLATALPFNVPGGSVSGRYSLKVSAWEADGLTPRRVASTGRSELRILPNANSYRVSTTETRLVF